MNLSPAPDFERRMRRVLQKLERVAFEKSVEAGVEISAPETARNYHPDAAAAVAHARALDFSPISRGGEWGAHHSTVWFRIRGKLPAGWRGRKVVCRFDAGQRSGADAREGFGAEGLFFLPESDPVAWTPQRNCATVLKKARGGESVEVWVEATANLCPDCLPGGHDSGTDEQQPLFQFNGACFISLEPAAEKAVADFNAAWDALGALPQTGQLAADLRAALLRVEALPDQPDPFRRISAILRPVMDRKNGGGAHRIFAAGHSHIDTAWLWPAGETIRKCARTFLTQLDLLDSHPAHRFVISPALHLAWMQRHYPEIFDRIKKAVRAGRVDLPGMMWVESDCNLVSGESLARQLLHGAGFYRENFGQIPKGCWLPDSFGFPASLPRILAAAGVRWFSTRKLSGNRLARFPHTSFVWKGEDGSAVLVHLPPVSPRKNFPGAEVLSGCESRNMEKERAGISLMLFGRDDGGCGPEEEMFQRLERFADFAGLPVCRPSGVSGFFEELQNYGEALPVWHGPLLIESHRGTYTSQGALKRANRKNEVLLREAEFADAIGSILFPARKEKAVSPVFSCRDVDTRENSPRAFHTALERAWKLLLLNQFHDILPGVSVAEVVRDALADHNKIAELAHSVIEGTIADFSKAIDLSGFERPFFVGNPLAFRRGEIIELPGGVPCPVDIPPCGYAVIEAAPAKHPAPENPVLLKNVRGAWILENGLLRLRLDAHGNLVSVFDIEAGREVLESGKHGNELQLLPDEPLEYDAWNIDGAGLDGEPVILDRAESVEALPPHPAKCSLRVVRRFGDSRIVQEISLPAGSRRIDFVTEADWHERNRLLKAAFHPRLSAPSLAFEIPSGVSETPSNHPAPPDPAMREFCALQWVDLSEPGYGVAVLNDCKSGHDFRCGVLRISLLRAPCRPDPASDNGHHVFSYALLPHSGGWREAGVPREALIFNHPIRCREIETGGRKQSAGSLPSANSFLSLEPESLDVVAFKRAENGRGVIVRLVEPLGMRGRTTLSFALPFAKWTRTDLLERDSGPLEKIAGGRIRLSFLPSEIITLRLI